MASALNNRIFVMRDVQRSKSGMGYESNSKRKMPSGNADKASQTIARTRAMLLGPKRRIAGAKSSGFTKQLRAAKMGFPLKRNAYMIPAFEFEWPDPDKP